jgi:cytoskeletal protein CcmA (bactofilin family)
MTSFGKGTSLKGELRASEDITVEGRVEGWVLCEDCAIVFAASSDVSGEILGRDLTVFGRLSGQVVATDVVDIRAGATVRGRIIAPRVILDESAHFEGHVEPQHLDAALSVARYRQRKRDTG